MILINKKQIDDKTKAGQFISAKIAEYSDRKEPIEFQSYLDKVPKRFTVTEDGKPTARREETQGVWIGAQEHYIIPEVGKVLINWVRDLPDIGDNGEYRVRKTLIPVIKGRLKVYPQIDPDKAFFLCEVSSVVKNGDVTIIDREKDDQVELDKTSDESMITFMIAHKNSPIAPETIGSEDILRDLAASWGVINSENLPLSTLRKNLIINVKQSQQNYEKTKRGYDAFVADIQALQKGGNNDVKIRKDIQLAIEKKLLVHEEDKVILFPNTDIQRVLLKHRPTEGSLWIEKTLDYFLGDPKLLENLKKELYWEEKMTFEEKNRNFDDISLTSKIEQVQQMRAWPQVLKIYKDLGLEEKDIPAEDKMKYIKERIITHYKETGS